MRVGGTSGATSAYSQVAAVTAPDGGPSESLAAVYNVRARAAAAGAAFAPLTLSVAAQGRWGVAALRVPSHAAFVTADEPVPFNDAARLLRLALPASVSGGAGADASVGAAALARAHSADLHVVVEPRAPPGGAPARAPPAWWEAGTLPARAAGGRCHASAGARHLAIGIAGPSLRLRSGARSQHD